MAAKKVTTKKRGKAMLQRAKAAAKAADDAAALENAFAEELPSLAIPNGLSKAQIRRLNDAGIQSKSWIKIAANVCSSWKDRVARERNDRLLDEKKQKDTIKKVRKSSAKFRRQEERGKERSNGWDGEFPHFVGLV